MITALETKPLSDSMKRVVDDIRQQVYFEVEQVQYRLDAENLEGFAFEDADAIVQALGYDARRDRWRELSYPQAEEFIDFNIRHDLAYSSHELRPPADCLALAKEILALAGQPLRIFTRHTKETPDQDCYGTSPIRMDWTFAESYLLATRDQATLCMFLAED